MAAGQLFNLQSPFVERPALFIAADMKEAKAEIEVRLGVVRIERDRLSVGSDRIIDAFAVLQQNAEVVVRLRIIRPQRDSFAETGKGLIEALERMQRHGPIVISLGKIRL